MVHYTLIEHRDNLSCAVDATSDFVVTKKLMRLYRALFLPMLPMDNFFDSLTVNNNIYGRLAKA